MSIIGRRRSDEQVREVAGMFQRLSELVDSNPNLAAQFLMAAMMLLWTLREDKNET